MPEDAVAAKKVSAVAICMWIEKVRSVIQKIYGRLHSQLKKNAKDARR
jgi:hypothetical protein